MKHQWGDMAMLRAAAESRTDAIAMRIAMENRVQRGGAAADAEAAERLTGIARAAEADCRALLHSLYTEAVPEPVREWAAGIPGLASGEVFPALIGLIGDPTVATPYKWEIPDGGGPRRLVADGEPYDRSVQELWAWCGCGDPARRIETGMSQEQLLACGKRTVIRPLLFAFSSYIARSGRPVTKEGSAKLGLPVSQAVADSKYFKIFSDAKADGLTKVHTETCKNRKRPPQHSNGCGTVAHPEWGEPGSPWRPGHAEMHAHRVVGKELLRDLWIVSGGETPERILNAPGRPW